MVYTVRQSAYEETVVIQSEIHGIHIAGIFGDQIKQVVYVK